LVACSRFAVGRFLGCAVFPETGLPKPVKVSSVPLVEFRLRLEPWTTIPSRSHRSAASSSHGLCAPSAHKGNGDPLIHGLCLPATVRPQGLVTLSTAYALRTRAGFVSHRRRSWGLPFGAFPSRKVSSRFRRDEPTYRLARQYFRRRSVEPAQRASVSGFLPSRESLADRHGVSTPTGRLLPWVFPSKAFRRGPCRVFARSPLTRLARPTEVDRTCATESQSATAWPLPETNEIHWFRRRQPS
jgi:hypothetical protein